MADFTRVGFVLEPGFDKIGSREIERAFGEDEREVSGQLVAVEVCERDDMGRDVLMPRTFGSIDTLWRPIILTGSVNLLLSHPNVREVYFLTTMPVRKE